MKILAAILFASLFLHTPNTSIDETKPFADGFKLGNEVLLEEKSDILTGKNVAIITNTSGVVSDGRLFVDLLSANEGINLVQIFSPEHGFEIDDKDVTHFNKRTGLKVVSLYGNKKSCY